MGRPSRSTSRDHSAGTLVRLHEHGYPDTDEGRRRPLDCASGWGEALTLLELHVEHGLRYW